MLDIANTTLSSAPYFDDFSEDKKFYRVLFRPSVAVQARELTQIQDIMQSQISRIGDHIFKDGSIVEGCSVEYITDLEYVGIEDQFLDNSALTLDDPTLEGTIAIGANSGAQAYVVKTRSGFIRQAPGRLFLRYTTPGINSSEFIPGEEIAIYSSNTSYVEDIVLSVANAQPFATYIGLTVDSVESGNTANVIGRAIVVNIDSANNTVTVNNINRRFMSNTTLIVTSSPSVNSVITNAYYDVTNKIGTIRTLTSNTDGISISNADMSGSAYGASVSSGIIYHKGFFISVQPNTVVVNADSSDPSGYKIGFKTDESVITEYADSSLYDNAAGYNNFNAPGAHRLSLNSLLISRAANTVVANTDVFFPIVEFSNTGVAYDRTDPQYAALGDEIAKRTFEESGNYIVNPFKVSTSINKKDFSGLIYNVTPGLAYVKGYRTELLSNLPVVGQRGNDTVSYDDQIVTMSYGNYIEVNQLRGNFPTENLQTVNLYSAPQYAITNDKSPASTANGSVIGVANIINLIHKEGERGSANATYNVFLFNINMIDSAHSFSNVASIAYTSGSSNAFADITGTSAVLIDTNYSPLLFQIGASAVKTLKNAANVNNNEYYYTAVSNTATLDSTGYITFQVPSGGGILGFTDSSDFSEEHIDITLLGDALTANLTTTATTYSNGVITATGIGLKFFPGELVQNGVSTYPVTDIISNDSIKVSGATSNATGQTICRLHRAGSAITIDGSVRTVTINSNKQATVNLGDNYTTSPTAAIVRFYALQNQATGMSKNIARGSTVIIDVDASGSPTGPWNLGVPDILKLNAAYLVTGSGSNITAAITDNLVDDFTLNNGQKDAFYDHGSVTLSQSASVADFTGAKIIFTFDHFLANSTTGKGFFSVDSYPIDDSFNANTATLRTYEVPSYFSSSSAKSYDLRDVLDFRPYKQATATFTKDIRLASTNPATTTVYNSDTTDYQPFPGQNFQLNYTHYLPRRDILSLSPSGVFEIVKGVSSLAPRTPLLANGSLIVADINVPPYPSLTDEERRLVDLPNYNISVNVQNHQRFTMSDIGALKQRIQNLEYYTSLNTLQIAAANTTVLSDDGSARFRNGIFVDPFNDHSFGRVDDPQYAIAIDQANGFARPLFQPEFFDMAYDASRSSGITRVGDKLLMSFGEVPFLEQKFATGTRLLSGSVPTYNGGMNIFPIWFSQIDALKPPAFTLPPNNSATAAIGNMLVSPLQAMFGWWRADDPSRPAGAEAYTTVDENNNAVVRYGKNPAAYINMDSTTSYLRSRLISFKASGLKPYTKFNVVIDNVGVGEYTAPGINASDSLDETCVTRTGMWGSDLISSSRGELFGTISIPAKMFYEGPHTVYLSSVNGPNFVPNPAAHKYYESAAVGSFTGDVSYSKTPPVVIAPPHPVPPAPVAPVLAPPAAGAPPVSVPISVPNTILPPPAADILPSAYFTTSGEIYVTAPVNHSITVTDGSANGTNVIVSWNWDFGDGTSYSGKVPPAHTYGAGITGNSTDPYTITLTVTDSKGLVSTYTQKITLYKLAPPPTSKVNITAWSNQTIIGTGAIGGVYEANINMVASTTEIYTGAYYNWTIDVISGNTLSSNTVSGTANNTCISKLIDTSSTHGASLSSTFIADVKYQYANGFIIGEANTQFNLWTMSDVPVILTKSVGGGCVVAEAWLNNSTKAIDVLDGFVADTWSPGEIIPTPYAVVEISQPSMNDCVRMTTESGITLTCSVATPFNMKNASVDLEEGEWEWASDMLGKEVLVDDEGVIGWETVIKVEHVGKMRIVQLGFNARSFAAGDEPNRRIYSHNMMKMSTAIDGDKIFNYNV